ncbi:MAG: LysR substrate-binding domain-containing protein [Pseudomonadota bacterium]
MSLDLKSLELFVRVATVGALGKAGAEFGLSPTSTTQRIQALEKVVGVPLLHRSTRAISLSKDGEVFLAHAKRILADVEDALADVQYDPSTVRGELTVASAASFGRLKIAPFIGEFMETCPGVSVHLNLTDATIDIIEDQIDVAIRLGVLAPSSLIARKIGRSPRVIVAAPAYLERFGSPALPSDLSQHHVLLRGEMKSLSFVGPDGGECDVKITGKFSTNHAEAITEAALSGLGIARKCRWEIEPYLASGALITVLDAYTVTPEWDIHSVRPPAKQQPPRVRAFVDFLEAKFRSIPAVAP